VHVTPDERERMAILCERIASEQDPGKFTKFVDELNELLACKEARLEHRPARPVSPKPANPSTPPNAKRLQNKP